MLSRILSTETIPCQKTIQRYNQETLNNTASMNGQDYQLKAAIKAQMQPASCVLILAGVYATYSKWINIEIELAQSMGKTIIAIEPWGSEHTSTVVKRAADKIVKWNTDSIVSAIRGY